MSEEPGKYEVAQRPDVGIDIVEYDDGQLRLTVKPTWAEAVKKTNTMDKIGRNAAWWMGDWLNYIEELFGERWTQLIPDIGWEEGTLQNYKWVANAIHPDVREPRLPWSTHTIVAKLTPDLQAMWLERALEGGWSGRQLAKEIKGDPEKAPKQDKDAIINELRTERDTYKEALEAIRDNDENDLGVYARFAVDTAVRALGEV